MTNQIDPATARAMLQLLTRLRRKGAAIEPTSTIDGAPWVVTQPGGKPGMMSERLAIDAHVVEFARDQGWIAPDGDPNRLRLTEVGVLKLTRGLAAVAGAANVVPAKPRERRTTTRRNDSEPTAVARLKRQRGATGGPLLSGVAAEAAERIANDFIKGQMQPRVTANWDKAILGQRPEGMAPGLGIDLRDAVAAAQERVRCALDHVGSDHAGVLIDVCCLDKGLEDVEAARGWPRGTARVVLGIALNMLAAHYGLVARGPVRGKTSRWGTGDDRPTLDAWR